MIENTLIKSKKKILFCFNSHTPPQRLMTPWRHFVTIGIYIFILFYYNIFKGLLYTLSLIHI